MAKRNTNSSKSPRLHGSSSPTTKAASEAIGVKIKKAKYRELSLTSLPKVGNAVTPATWFDAAAIMMRSDIPVATLQFFHFMPDAAVEVLRMQTSASCLIAMIDMLAKAVDHYPVKPTEPKSDATS